MFNSPLKYRDIEFKEFGEPNAPNYCFDYLSVYNIIGFWKFVPGICIQGINVISIFIFIYIVSDKER